MLPTVAMKKFQINNRENKQQLREKNCRLVSTAVLYNGQQMQSQIADASCILAVATLYTEKTSIPFPFKLNGMLANAWH